MMKSQLQTWHVTYPQGRASDTAFLVSQSILN